MQFTITLRRALALVLSSTALLLAALPSSAVPAFARQTGKACSSCHFQHFPVLNDFGQEFKAGGYVDIKNKPLTGNDLSLADSLYVSLFSKFRFIKTDGSEAPGMKSTHSGEWQLPDEFALLAGGRIGKNVGFLIEGALANGSESVLAGFKLPAIWEVGGDFKLGVVPFSTDSLGASYGFELLSTGAVQNIRASEAEFETSAQQYVFFQDGTSSAAGFTFLVHSPSFYASITPFMPNHLPGGDSNLGGLNATYFRAVATPKLIDGWSLAAGVQAWTGNNVRIGDGTSTVTTKGWAVDGQAHGAVAGMPLGVYLAHASAPGTSAEATSPNLFNPNPNRRSATTITAELGVIPQKSTVLLSYRQADDGSATNSGDNAFTLGVTYNLYQNLKFEAVHSTRDGNRFGPSGGGATGGGAQTMLVLAVGY
jgi:hypothetical protein